MNELVARGHAGVDEFFDELSVQVPVNVEGGLGAGTDVAVASAEEAKPRVDVASATEAEPRASKVDAPNSQIKS